MGRIRRLTMVLGTSALILGTLTVSVASTTVSASAATKFKACVVTDTGGINDRSFNQSAYADWLKDRSLIPLVSVTTQALNFVAAEADTVVEATLTVKVPRISALVPSTIVRRRILPMYFSLNRLISPQNGNCPRPRYTPTRRHHAFG